MYDLIYSYGKLMTIISTVVAVIINFESVPFERNLNKLVVFDVYINEDDTKGANF